MPVKQSASKEDFLKALGLNVSNPEDKMRLQQMWVSRPENYSYFSNCDIFQEEVTTFWMKHFETNSRQILKPEYANNPSVTRPYKWAHLDPAVIDSAITTIWKEGRQWPRVYYDRGATDDRRVYNWVLKWLLWHVCRYRDWRNRKARNPQSGGSSSSSSNVTVAGKLTSSFQDQANN
jgi:hypothetical protein